MPRDLARLLRPRSLAVIGGGVWAAEVVGQARKMGFDGPIWPVHPRKSVLGGIKTYPTIADLPGAPDAVWIGVNRHATVDIVRELAEVGAGGAICFASGFAEAGAEDAEAGDLQASLVAAAGDMPVLGPNCYGMINYLDGVCLWPDQHGGVACARGVAILAQSSNIAINLTMQARGVPIAMVVTCGNQAQTGMVDIAMAMLADPRVTALGLHIEGIGDIRGFEALAVAAYRAGKPIVALKIGRSEAARAATISHTASLAGSDAGGRALLARLGIGQVADVAGFLAALMLAHHTGGLASTRLVSASCSGGEASLVADMAETRGASFPALAASQVEGLRAALGPMVALANPLDYHTYVWGDVAAMTRAFAALPAPDTALALVICDFPRADRCTDAAWDCVIAAVEQAQAESGVRFAIVSTLPEGLSEERGREIAAAGVIPMCGLSETLDAVEAVTRTPPDDLAVLLPGAARQSAILDENVAKAALAAFGLDIPRGRVVTTAEDAENAAREIGGRVVLKGLGTAHKSEAGLVRVGVTAHDIAEAVGSMRAGRFLVEEQVGSCVAELLVGVVRDAAHGFVLTLAAGGVLTELLADRQHLLIPSSDAAIRAALGRLKIAPVLAGYRSAPPSDMSAIVAAVRAVQDYVTANADTLAEVEINPLICTPERAVAVDALIAKEAST